MRGTAARRTARRISIASARSRFLLGLHRRRSAPAQARARSSGPTTGTVRAHGREPRVRADQHVVETLKLPNTRPCWNVRAKPSAREPLRRQAGDVAAAKRHLPASAASRPVTRLNRVVLPAPFGPMMLTSSPSSTVESTRIDGRHAAEAARQAAHGQGGSRWSGGVHHTVPIRPCGRIADQQQQRDAVDQHAVLGGGAEQFRQADQRDRAEIAPATLPSPPRITIVSASSETCDVKVSWFM